jgi:hypothetical protein
MKNKKNIFFFLFSFQIHFKKQKIKIIPKKKPKQFIKGLKTKQSQFDGRFKESLNNCIIIQIYFPIYETQQK